ncbi:MAG: methionyl-tRNA formyltransferase [Lachnospiraceae bacterium]|nr:methionyl-tRNA formyltransferase [Lachnospiraceae bacterium]
MKVLFMGTPEIAATILEAIINSKHEVVGVVTQEDKPKGRGKVLAAPPVKEVAIKYGIEVFQPHIIKEPGAIERLRKFDADIFVVAAYGKILSKEILDIPKYGCINAHASLLPKYRGAAPIQWSIIDGEKVTGITIMQMDEGLDTGDMLFTKEVEISDEDTADTLYDKLSINGGGITVEALDKIEAGDVNPVKQDGTKATYAKMLDKSLGKLDFNKPAVEIERLVRGLNSWPGTYTYLNGKTLKIWKTKLSDYKANGEAGTVHSVENGRLFVNTQDEALEILEIQLEGKKRMDVKSFMLGYKLEEGEKLGQEVTNGR